MKLVIIAGGKGTRLGLKKIPKPMVKINDIPLLEYQIRLAKRYGFKDIYILSGHLSNIIVDYFGNGNRLDVNIHHIIEDKPLGTAGAIKQLESVLTERFMIFYGDTVMDIDLNRFKKFDRKFKNSVGSIIVHPNDHPFDSDLLETNSKNKVIAFHSKPHTDSKYYSNLVNAALYILSPKIFTYIDENAVSDFGKDIFPKVIKTENLYAYKTTEYIKDMGTPDRFDRVAKDVLNGKVQKLNKENKQKAVFLDRDGVINKEVNGVFKTSDFQIIDNVPEAIGLLNKSEYIVIVVTNQPFIAKGFMTTEDLELIHKKMDSILGVSKVFIDDLFYCPHHPEKGFDGEVTELKIKCSCRKPNSGMLNKAANLHNIDLNKSWIVGDRYTDIKAGINVGTKTILLQTGHSEKDFKNKVTPNKLCRDLKEAVKHILKEEE
tara:strand:+ start:921 stop:2216 length:1296 start_codon:yes stop_codon:yes gene_type:complete